MPALPPPYGRPAAAFLSVMPTSRLSTTRKPPTSRSPSSSHMQATREGPRSSGFKPRARSAGPSSRRSSRYRLAPSSLRLRSHVGAGRLSRRRHFMASGIMAGAPFPGESSDRDADRVVGRGVQQSGGLDADAGPGERRRRLVHGGVLVEVVLLEQRHKAVGDDLLFGDEAVEDVAGMFARLLHRGVAALVLLSLIHISEPTRLGMT